MHCSGVSVSRSAIAQIARWRSVSASARRQSSVIRSAITGSPQASRSAAPWATRQYRQPLAIETTTAIISRSAALRPGVSSWSMRKCANHADSRSGRNA